MNSETSDALMANICEHDVLWDGMLFPEIVDAEFYDCPESILPGITAQMIQIQLERFEALLTLIEVVKCYVETCIDAPLFSEEIDGELYDCPLGDATWFDLVIDPPDDWPSVESLK